MVVKMEYTKQIQIFNPENYNVKVIIVGAGSTGSFTALTLAKMGVQNIKVIDFDVIEAHNIPNQFYRLSDIDKPKVEALKEIIKDFTGTEIIDENIEIDDDYEFDIDMNTIIISCVDNIETRKLICEKLDGFPIKFIDTRLGGEGFSIHVTDMSNEKEVEEILKSLDLPVKETTCGSKGIIYTINSLASEVCNIVKKILKGECYPLLLRRELKTYRFIERKLK